MKFGLITTAALALAAASCASPIKVNVPFNAAEGAYIHKQGKGRVEGSAFLHKPTGQTVTAAGNVVVLRPVTTYSRGYMAALFHGGKYAPVRDYVEENMAPGFANEVRRTKADVDGRFAFDNVAPGEYYILTYVLWKPRDAYLPEGGVLLEQVTVRNNGTVRVIMNGT